MGPRQAMSSLCEQCPGQAFSDGGLLPPPHVLFLLGGDHNFSKLFSFSAQSQLFSDFEESAALVKPAVEGNLAIFAPPALHAAVGVGMSLPLIETTRAPSPATISLLPVRRSKLPPMPPCDANLLENLPPELSRKMPLDSTKIQPKSVDSWEDAKDEGSNAPVPNGGGAIRSAVKIVPCQCPPAQACRFTFRVPRHQVIRRRQQRGAAAQLIRDGDLRRSVLLAVEQRFRAYICTPMIDEAAELKNTRTKASHSATANPQQQRTAAAGAPSVAVQNLLDFFFCK
ncbi:hypothetical protein TraAM80_01167 [Trypanosoma rangeli]|uniref:Uncharacterized protein n=1 Tax=Trypanosoma rangeli TaxID=5698 RepID=A0A3R7LBI8_TRYRA|nr:uncharacterized protein TraAM80_01167 [Trypanosoma rangeli]RNF11040.1 hypothetical protein TraAM80_01167 [Trypanosoma rangeli]|eukprot:RNF11040.1 hypothetical protein TraAM80_01167 [Trypanosoma rangeli]